MIRVEMCSVAGEHRHVAHLLVLAHADEVDRSEEPSRARDCSREGRERSWVVPQVHPKRRAERRGRMGIRGRSGTVDGTGLRESLGGHRRPSPSGTPACCSASSRWSIPTGRSPSTTGRCWMPYCLARRAAAATDVLGETVTGSAVIHWRARPSLGCTRMALARTRSLVVRIPISRPDSATAAAVAPLCEQPFGDFADGVLRSDHDRIRDMSSSTPASSSSAVVAGVPRSRLNSSRTSWSSSTSSGTAPEGARRRSAGHRPCARCEERREVAADDLRRRPPQRLVRSGRPPAPARTLSSRRR